MRSFSILLFILFSVSGLKRVNFELKDIHEKTYRLDDFCGERAKIKKKAIVVSFFRLDCKECMRVEVPSLKRIYKDMKMNGLFVFLIGFGEGRWEVGDYFSQNPVDFPVLIDSTKKVGAEWGIFGVPNTFIIDGNCNIRFHLEGSRKDYEEFIRKKVSEVLKE